MGNLRILLLALIGLVGFSPSLLAQTHFHTTRVIDGQNNPELIPDVMAYRLYFLAVTATDNSPEETAKETAHLSVLGLNFSDAISVRVALDEFRAKYNALETSYNAKDHSRNGDADYAAFTAVVDKLVLDTVQKIADNTTADGLDVVSMKVKAEKKGMQLVTQQ